MSSSRRRLIRRTAGLAALVSLGLLGTGCGDSANDGDAAPVTAEPAESTVADEEETATTVAEELPTVVVTYSALESVVSDLVGDLARVVVIIPNGTDPHDFEPSAKDLETMSQAAIVVANGLGLEEGLTDALDQTEDGGVPVFHIADHVTLREGSSDEHSHGDEESHDDGDTKAEAEASEEADHDHGAEDPHVWLDPLTLSEAMPALAQEIGGRIGSDLTAAADAVVASLAKLNSEIEAKIATLESCVVITGHDSLGYFGARYGCEVLGSIIPSFSTAAEATAKDLVELKELAKAEGVKAIFTELGTPSDVAEQLASEVGVEVVDIATHVVPDGGGYDEMMIDLAERIVSGLS